MNFDHWKIKNKERKNKKMGRRMGKGMRGNDNTSGMTTQQAQKKSRKQQRMLFHSCYSVACLSPHFHERIQQYMSAAFLSLLSVA